MDRHRGDRYGGDGRGSGGGGNGYRNNYSHEDSQGQDFHRDIRRPSRFSDGPSHFSDGPSRFSDGPPMNPFPDNVVSSEGSYNNRSSHGYRAGSGGGGRRAFESPPQLPPGGFGGTGGFPSMGAGGGFRQIEDGDGGGGHFGTTYPGLPPPPPLSGQKRSHPMSGRGGSPTSDRSDGGNFAKLFVGSVPRTATEEEIRPLFEKEGNVIEVALIKDKRTGQQQGCCFVKYATIEEADRAVRALHNQHTLPGGVGPIQVRYADGERERLGAVEYKLFVGSLNKQATEKEVEEIFAPYGRVEDVYLMRDEMKQSRGCGFVKYSQRDTALAAINSLNGTYTMRGCNQPLTVRFADPKRPKPGDSSLPRRGGPGFEDPGFGSQFQVPIPRPEHNYGGSMGDRAPPNPWHPITPKQTGPPPGAGVHGLGNPLPPFNQGGFGGPPDGTSQEAFFSPGNRPLQQVAPTGQQIQPTQKPVRSPQSLQASLPLNPHVASNYSQTQMPHPGQQNLPSYSQALPSQQLHGFTAPAVSAAAPTNPLTISLQSQSRPGAAPNPPQQSAPAQQQPQPLQQQSPSQLAQMLCQQKQTLQASFQSSQQAFSQLQQQVQMMQSSSVHQNSQAARSQWAGMPQHTVASSPATTLALDVPPTAKIAPVAQPAAAKHSNWTEHTSPEGFKYYYNNVTGESQWEKPDELISTEQQQSQTKPLAQLPQAQQNPGAPQNHQAVQGQSMHPGAPQNQQAGQGNPMQFPAQFQTQYRPQHPTQQPSFHSGEHGYAQMPVPADSANDQTKLQFQQAAQDWMWKNKPTGS